VFSKASHHQNKILKAIALICVYSLHLIFFEAVMAKPNDEATECFKNFFNRDSDKKKSNSSSSAVHYYHLHKHANNSERLTFVCNDVVLDNPPVIALPQVAQPPVSLWLFYAHLPDDAFKIYQRIRVFLI